MSFIWVVIWENLSNKYKEKYIIKVFKNRDRAIGEIEYVKENEKRLDFLILKREVIIK